MPVPTKFKTPSPLLVQSVLSIMATYHPISTALRDDFIQHSLEISLKKNDLLSKRGEMHPYLYFVLRGIVSGCVTEKKGSITTFISVPGDFVCPIEGMYGLSPCTEDIRAEEDADLLAIHADHLFRFFDLYPEANIIIRKIFELYYITAHQRSVFFRLGTASDKYQFFLNTYTRYANRIPLKTVASFLNVKMNTLQKIIKEEGPKQEHDTGISEHEIIKYMDEQQPFRQKKLTISQLSIQLNVSVHTLSQLLNKYFNQNFNHFINSYRIKYVLDQLVQKSNLRQYSLDGLGSEAGFSSRSSFFVEFKKHIGATPFTYLKSLS
jgi:AraC-like DNA-binding protein